MSTGLRLIAEHYDIKTGSVINSTIIIDEELCKATTIKQLGYLHIEQIGIIKKIQDSKITPQILLNNLTICPVCNNKTFKDGKVKSTFHSVLTDHTVLGLTM